MKTNSQLLNLALLAALLVLQSGCFVDALIAHRKKEQVAQYDERNRQEIERAYAAKDVAALAELVKNTPPPYADLAQHDYVALKVEVLVGLECDDFAPAFEPTVTKDGRTTRSTANPLTNFGVYVKGFDVAARDRIVLAVAERALACNAPEILFTRRMGLIDHRVNGEWARIYAALEARGVDVYGPFVRFMGGKARLDDSGPIVWLNQTKPASKCAELEAASQSSAASESNRASLLYFFANRSCRKEATTVARELFGSRVAAYRARACSALRDVGETGLQSQMQLLANTDPARKLETQEVGYWEYATVSYPVRETCQQALNELRLKVAPQSGRSVGSRR